MHSILLSARLRLGDGKQRGHPVGEPDRCQGPVRQVVVFDHCVTGRKDLVHHYGPLHGHRRVGAHVLLRVNPFNGHGFEPTSLWVEHEHFLAALDLAGEYRRHPVLFRGVVANEEEVRSGESDFLAGVGFEHVKKPAGGRVLVYEHDEVGVNRVPAVIRRQDSVAGLEIFDQLLGAVLKGDSGGAWEAAPRLCCH